MNTPRILAFDTSGHWCAAALLSGSDILDQRLVSMAKGQAEHLVPMLEGMLRDAGITWADLTALAVGTGPGNFTGLRISVSLARGLALGLGVPAIGVTGFESLALEAPRPALATLPAPRDQLYGQLWTEAGPRAAQLFPAGNIPADLTLPGMTLLGAAEGARPSPRNPAPAIARVAATRPGDSPAPAPFYLRPADAAPPRDAPPRIIP